VTVKPLAPIAVPELNTQFKLPLGSSTSTTSSISHSGGMFELADEISLLVMQQWVLLCEQLAPLIRVL
jgi:hypothetical protein